MDVHDLTGCMLSGRACGPVIGFAAMLGIVFLSSAWGCPRGDHVLATGDVVGRSFLDAGIVAWTLFLLVGTLSPLGASGDSLNLVPFNYLARSLELGGVDLRNALFDVVANVAVFVPLGLLVGMRFARPSAAEWFIEIACLMIAVEVAQAYGLHRSGDITDVITNTIGAAIGLAVGRAIRRRRIRDDRTQSDTLSVPRSG